MQPPKNGNSGHLKPTGKPIYAANEKELQKKIKNRQSALESRRKNKEKFERLGKFYFYSTILIKPKPYPETTKFELHIRCW